MGRTRKNEKSPFAENLTRLRKARGFKSADAFADSHKISRSTYRDWEQGASEPHRATRPALAHALGVTEAQLFADPNLEQSPDMVNVLDIGQLAKQLSSELHKISPQSQNEELNDQEKDLITFFRRLPSAKLKKVALEFVRDLTDLDPLPNETQMPALRRRLR